MKKYSAGKQKQVLGRRGEEIAVAYLEKKGYELRARNYRCRFGEIDIIAEDKETLVFVEVRCRRSTCFGWPQESIGVCKQRRIKKIAAYYLQTVRARDGAKYVHQIRFDVVAILEGQGQLRIEHIKNAF